MTTIREPAIEWMMGTAYDFFVSLIVLHEPEKYGLRGSWAAGVRSRLPVAEREIIQQAKNVIWPMRWVTGLPEPRDAVTALAALSRLDAEQRLLALMSAAPEPVVRILHNVAARRVWREEDLRAVVAQMQQGDWRLNPPAVVRQDLIDMLNLWASPVASADGLLSALNCYYDSFFAEEEERIRPILERARAWAQQRATKVPQAELLEELSQGVRLSDDLHSGRLVVAPSFWATPFVILASLADERRLFIFGARPADASLVPGELVPDALHQALKALADPTRLRILRYLTDEPLAPTELARRLRLRPPTVMHHLDALRLARLVIITLEREGKRYAVRPDGVASVFALLDEFLAGKEE